MPKAVEVTLRLGWEADSLSHDGWQYEANEDGTFTVPREVYFDFRERGLAVEYISEEEIEEEGGEVVEPPAADPDHDADSDQDSTDDPGGVGMNPPLDPPADPPGGDELPTEVEVEKPLKAKK